MSEEPDFPGPDEPEQVPPEPERVRTEMAEIDEVIVAVEELEDRPIEEHVGVFETAHDRLRRALDRPADPVDPA